MKHTSLQVPLAAREKRKREVGSDAPRLLTIAAATFALGLLLVPRVLAATISVNSTAQSPGAAGDCTLGEAIQAANTDAAVDGCTAGSGADTIMIPAGTYTLTLVDNMTNGPNGLPAVTSSITFQGASAATTIIERNNSMGMPEFRLLHINDNSGATTFNDLTLRRGGFPLVLNQGGGALQVRPGNPLTINRCVLEGNASAGGGGALFTFDVASITITDSIFGGNTSKLEGGAAITNNSPLTVTNSNFFVNISALAGGGIVTSCSACTFADSTFIFNGSPNGGGAIFFSADHGPVAVTRSLFSDNGSAISNVRGPLTVTDSYFAGNNSDVGGAIRINDGTTTITGSTFSGNFAAIPGGGGDGGALWLAAPTTITNSTFFGNNAEGRGGAIFVTTGLGSLTLNNVTIARNRGVTDGGGIAQEPGAGSVTLANSILAGNNIGRSGDSRDCSGTMTSQGFNLVAITDGCTIAAAGGDQLGTAASPLDVALDFPRDNGGIMAGSNVGGQTPITIPTIALIIGSPALQGGNPAMPGSGFPACEATDQRGFLRNVGACDSGAFEDATGTGLVPDVDLSVLNFDMPDPVRRGDNLTYDVFVNSLMIGSTFRHPAPGVVLTNNLDPSMTFVSATPTNGTTCMEAAGTITCNLGTTDGVSVRIVVMPTLEGVFNNTTTVTSTGNEIDPTNNSVTISTTVRGVKPPDLSIDDVATAEGNAGTSNFTFTVSLSAAGESDVMVDFATANGTAVQPGDYTQTTGTLTIPVGMTSGSIMVPVVGETVDEPDETFFVNLSNAVNGNLVDNQGQGRIIDDDPEPNITINDVTVAEGNAGTSNATFTVSMSAASNFDVMVTFATADGTAVQPDYTQTTGTLTIPAGMTSGTITVPVLGDTTIEPNETFVVNLSNAVNARLVDSQGQGTITNDDTDFTLTAMPASVTVVPGGIATYTITITPNPLPLALDVALSCDIGLPTGATCQFTPNPVPAPSSPSNSNLVIRVPATATRLEKPLEGGKPLPTYALWLALSGLGVVGLVLLRSDSGGKGLRNGLVWLLVAGALMSGASGCGQEAVAAPERFTVTVLAVSGSLTHTTTMTLTVQP